MMFSEWQALSQEERIRLHKSWKPYEQGYWHELNIQAVEQFKKEYGNHPKIRKIVGGTFHGGVLIIGVCKNVPEHDRLAVPEDYYGFRVIQLGQ